MRLPILEHPRARRFTLIACALSLSSIFFAACELDGASKKPRAASEVPAATAGAQSPNRRASLPMPPAESAHRTNSRQQGWTGLDGRRAKIEDFRGQAVVLDFYATYCPPCLEEIPHLVKLQKRFGPQGLKVIGLNVGGEEDQAKVPEFVKRLDIQYQLGNPDWEFVDAFFGGNSAIPQTLVFDRQGRLVKHLTGYDNEIAAQLEEAVQTALEAKTTTTDE
jgi:cytochrome c biogenesis protein CcmG/thiol:disulfide interchange protein DsbE